MAMALADGWPRVADPTPEGDELWRVFVLLRHRPGVYERAVRASGPLHAEHAVAIADAEVLATLGSRFLGRGHDATGADARYRGLRPAGRRFLEVPVPRKRSSGSTVLAPLPIVEVLAPRPGRGG